MDLMLVFENRRSHPVWPTVLGLLTAASLVLGGSSCVIVTDDHDDMHHMDSPSPPDTPITQQPALVDIDVGVEIPAEPGDGVGMFVEHLGQEEDGDTWRVFTTCDTNFSGYACAFDAILDAPGLRVVEEQDLEYDDFVSAGVDRAYFTPNTAYGTDGVVLHTDPNAILRLEMYLDGRSEPRFVYWVGNGVLHAGAPTNPVEFSPVAPAL